MNGIVPDHLAEHFHSLSLTSGFFYLRNRNYLHWVSYIVFRMLPNETFLQKNSRKKRPRIFVLFF